jgi:hypothetical protein
LSQAFLENKDQKYPKVARKPAMKHPIAVHIYITSVQHGAVDQRISTMIRKGYLDNGAIHSSTFHLGNVMSSPVVAGGLAVDAA